MDVRCSWPALGEPYDLALRAAVDFVVARYDPIGLIASGSIVRGTADASSDLDVYVVIRRLERQRVQRRFHGVPAEIFVNPPVIIRRYFAEEGATARPLTAHMLATGHVVLALDPVVETLREEARAWLAQRVDLTPEDVTRERYLCATRFEDAMDVAGREPGLASALAVEAVLAMLELQCRIATGFVPRRKDLLVAVEKIDGDLAALARALFDSPSNAERVELAGAIADRAVGARGFFEWESALEPVAVDTVLR